MENGELKKAYEAIEMLKALELPVSNEQMYKIYELEKTYIKEEIIPIIKGEIEPLVKDMMGNFHLEVSYSKDDGVKVHCLDNYGAHENIRGRRKATETRCFRTDRLVQNNLPNFLKKFCAICSVDLNIYN